MPQFRKSKSLKSPQVPPPLFGPYGRKWIDISGLRARYKIAQGSESPSEPEMSSEPPRVKPQGNLNTPKPRQLTTEERMNQPPPSSSQETSPQGTISDPRSWLDPQNVEHLRELGGVDPFPEVSDEDWGLDLPEEFGREVEIPEEELQQTPTEYKPYRHEQWFQDNMYNESQNLFQGKPSKFGNVREDFLTYKDFEDHVVKVLGEQAIKDGFDELDMDDLDARARQWAHGIWSDIRPGEWGE